MSRFTLLLLVACGPATPTDAPDTALEAPVTCDWSSPGPAMLEGTIEAEQQFAERLAALDVSTIPDPIDLSELAPFQRGVANWMIGRDTGREVSHAELEQAGMLGQAVLVAATGEEGFDFRYLREGLQYAYHCSRPVPADLDEVRARYGDYESWGLTDLPCGLPKDERRKVWTRDDDAIVIAETVTEDGAVRETEILFRDLRDDGQLDFAAYNWNGVLMDRSTFATGGGPTTFGAPYICVSCHASENSVDVQRPVGLGAGCQQP